MNGKVVGITLPEEVTKKNIQAILNGESVSMVLKSDKYKKWDESLPLLLNPNVANKDNILYQSLFTNYLEGFGSQSANRINKITCINETMKWLFQVSLGKFSPEYWADNRIILELKDSSKVFYYGDKKKDPTGYENWRNNNVYCYELNVPTSVSENLKFQIMLDEVNRFAGLKGIEGVVEKRLVKTISLIRIDSSDKITTEGGVREYTKNAYFYKAKNIQMGVLLGDFQSYFMQKSTLPIINETGFMNDKKIDIEINAPLYDIRQVRLELKKYGLDLVERENQIDMIVIRDR
jgi:hypothetical protein